MKRIKVRSFLEDVKRTAAIPKERSKMIEDAPAKELVGAYRVNILADELHPKNFPLSVKKSEVFHDFIYVELVAEDSDKVFWFKGGQLLGVRYAFDGKENFSSLPVMSMAGDRVIKVVFPRVYDSNAFLFFSENSASELTGVSFEGNMTYSSIRDKKCVVILADAFSLACAVSLANGIKKNYPETDITLVFDCEDPDISKKVFEETDGIAVKSISTEEKLPISENTTLFVTGSKAFCDGFIESDVFKSMKPANVRIHPFAVLKEYEGVKQYSCKVIYRGDSFDISCREGEKLTNAFLKAGIPSDIRCTDGECGYCRCRLLSGEVVSLCSASDSRTGADKKYGYIHPCSVTPVSDITVEL